MKKHLFYLLTTASPQGFVLFGISTAARLPERIRSMQVSVPFPLRILKLIRGTERYIRNVERNFHGATLDHATPTNGEIRFHSVTETSAFSDPESLPATCRKGHNLAQVGTHNVTARPNGIHCAQCGRDRVALHRTNQL